MKGRREGSRNKMKRTNEEGGYQNKRAELQLGGERGKVHIEITERVSKLDYGKRASN